MSMPLPKRIVVKIGSSSLVNTRKQALISQCFTGIAADMAWLSKHQNMEIVLMSSGALAWGRIVLGKQIVSQENITPQVAGAIGQIGMSSAWKTAFDKVGMAIGQFLLKPGDVASNLTCSTIDTMLNVGIVPYINENIPVMDSYDNDGLSAEVAQALGCKTLVLLSDVDGVYTANPATNPDAKLISEITNIDDAVERFGGGAISGIGTGGMLTKLLAAKAMKAVGVETIIASGQTANPLHRVFMQGAGTRIR